MKDYVRNRLEREPEYREQLRAASRKKHKRNRETGKEKAYQQSCVRRWLYLKTRNALSNFRHYEKRGRHIPYDITLDFLCDLWEKQSGRCALTNIPMAHIYHSPYSASIDRIDSSRGYTEDNVQLICQSVNLMKNSYSNDLIKEFILAIRSNHVQIEQTDRNT